MKNLEIRWEEKRGTNSSGSVGYVGKYPLFNTYWAKSGDSKGSTLPPWGITTKLPFIEINKRFVEKRHAQDACKEVLDYWLTSIGVTGD